jgi:hypothetical protein
MGKRKSVPAGGKVGGGMTDIWDMNMAEAPRDGTIVNVVGRYLDATAGFPRYAAYINGEWLEYSRFAPQPLVVWAWRERGNWPREPHRPDRSKTAAEIATILGTIPGADCLPIIDDCGSGA